MAFTYLSGFSVDGNVGIGTTAPSSKLSIGANAITTIKPTVSISDLTNGGSLNIRGISPILSFDKTGAGVPKILMDGGGLQFKTGTLDAEGDVDVVIDSAGNVGIGTTSPSTKFHVYNGEATIASSTDGVKLSYSSGNSSGIIDTAFSDNNLEFRTNGTAKMWIANAGNVGIGTTAPTEKLHIKSTVSGSFIRFEDNGGSGVYVGSRSNELEIYAGGSERMKIDAAGAIQFNAYNDANNTGTPTYLLGTDGSGNIVKTNTVPGSAAGPYLPLAGGTMTGTSGVVFPDNFKAKFGTGNDLQIYHDGNNSYINDAGTGSLLIRGNNVVIGKYTGETLINAVADGRVDLYYDNSIKITTTNAGAEVTGDLVVTGTITGSGGSFLPIAGGTMTGNIVLNDNVKSIYGTASDGLEIYHDSNNSYIKDTGTGTLNIQGSTQVLIGGSNGQIGVQYIEGVDVKLRHANSTKLATASTGVNITGALSTTTNVEVGANATFVDNGKAIFGAGSDLQIYHDGSNSFINDTGTGSLFIKSNGAGVYLKGYTSTDTYAQFLEGGAVNLYYDNSKKFETTGTGVSVTGDAVISGSIQALDSNLDLTISGDTSGNAYYNNLVGTHRFRAGGSSVNSMEISSTFITLNEPVTASSTVTATTFLGDLSGTINTVTTAVTKANATNDTTVATTAFVQNLIGTIPAGLVFQGTWNASTNTPTLTSGTGTTGYFYIVSTSGSTNLDGVTDWVTGDWAVFIEQGGTDAWEKIDNSSVLDGAGTGQTLPLWSGSGTSNTLTDSRFTQTATANRVTSPGNASTDSALEVQNASATNLLRVRGNGIVEIPGNYLHVNASSGAYIDGLLRARGGVTDDSSTLGLGGSGSITNLTLTSNTTATFAGDVKLSVAKKLYFGGGDHTYIGEDVDDRLRFFTGGAEFMRFTEGTTDTVHLFEKTIIENVLEVDDKVGIGIVPVELLDIQSASGDARIRLDAPSGSDTEVKFFNAGVAQYTIGHDDATDNFVIGGVNVDAPLVSVDKTGNVGIGTTAPQALLDVNKDSATIYDASQDSGQRAGTATIHITNQDTTVGSFGQIMYDSDGSNQAIARIVFIDSGTASVDTAFVNEHSNTKAERMRITSAGNVGIGTTAPSSLLTLNKASGEVGILLEGNGTDVAKFKVASAGVNHAVQIGTISNNEVQFHTNNTEKMRIDGAGNVGIGTTSPDVRLEVVEASPTNGIVADFVNSTNAGGTVAAIKLSNSDSENCDVVLGANRVAANFGSDFFISLSDNVDGSNQERFRITEAGNVGIGTTAPEAKLQVDGGIQMSDDTDTASASKVGTQRYRTSGNNSYVDMCMQTGASTYEWINIVQNNW